MPVKYTRLLIVWAFIVAAGWLQAGGAALAAPSGVTPRVCVSMSSAELQKLDIPDDQIHSVRLTDDGRRLVIVVHRPGKKARLVELDATTGRLAADVDVDLDFVQVLATTADGSKALAVGDYASKAVAIDVAARACTTVFTKESSPYRFSLPVSVTSAPDGTWITRGYTVDKDDVAQGDELTALRIEPGKPMVTTRLLDLDALLAQSAIANGQLLALNRTPDGRCVVFSVARNVQSCTLFVQRAPGEKPRAVLDADAVGAITMGRDDGVAYATVRRGDSGELVALDLKNAKARTLARGVFTPVLLGAGDRWLMTGTIAPRLASHDLVVGQQGSRYKLSPLQLAGWRNGATYYSLSARSGAFALWTKNRIVIGTLGN